MVTIVSALKTGLHYLLTFLVLLSAITLLQFGFSLSISPSAFSQFAQILAVGQSSILAIVVSVSLLIVQVTSSEYTPLASTVYKRGAIFRNFIILFGFSIFLDLVVVLLYPSTSPPPLLIIEYSEYRIGLTLAAILSALLTTLAVAGFVTLLSVRTRLFDFLNVETILDSLVDATKNEQYDPMTPIDQVLGERRDPLLEIFQIATESMRERKRFESIQSVLALSDATISLLDQSIQLDNDEQSSLNEYSNIFDYWDSLVTEATDNKMGGTLRKIAVEQQNIAIHAADQSLTTPSVKCVNVLLDVCKKSQTNGMLHFYIYTQFENLMRTFTENLYFSLLSTTAHKLMILCVFFEGESTDNWKWGEENQIINQLHRYFLVSLNGLIKNEDIDQVSKRTAYLQVEARFGAAIATHVSEERPALKIPTLDKLKGIGICAASNNDQWAVSRAVRMIIELEAFTDSEPTLSTLHIKEIIRRGGAAGVVDAFNTVLECPKSGDVDLITATSYGPIRLESGLDPEFLIDQPYGRGRIREIDDQPIYANLLRFETPINRLETYPSRVMELRKEVIRENNQMRPFRA